MKHQYVVAALIVIIFSVALCTVAYASTHKSPANDITSIFDGSVKTSWRFTAGQELHLDVPVGKQALLMRFKEEGNSFTYTLSGNSTPQTVVCNKLEYCVTLPQGCRGINLQFGSTGALCSTEFIKETRRAWQDAPDKCDILVFSAHQDDEHIFLGGLIPLFTDAGKTVEVAYVSGNSRVRKDEALEGLWRAGVRYYPDFLGFKDVRKKMETLQQLWGGDELVLGKVVETIRKRRPEIIATHDFNGEYGHGAHIYTASLVSRAVKAAADAGQYPESALKYGAWQTKKLYVHLYNDNTVRLNYSKQLKNFGNRTAAQVSIDAYTAHASQVKGQNTREYNAINGLKYDSSMFGLFYSTVGYENTQFFANIDDEVDETLTVAKHCWYLDVPNFTPKNTPLITLTPTPTYTPTPTHIPQRPRGHSHQPLRPRRKLRQLSR